MRGFVSKATSLSVAHDKVELAKVQSAPLCEGTEQGAEP